MSYAHRSGSSDEWKRDRASAYLRGLRTDRGLTVRGLAGSSKGTPAGFEKSYVAKLEAGQIPAQVRKFLTYMRLVGASVDYLAECLETAVPDLPHAAGLGVDEVLSRAKECVRTGDYELAMSWVLAALHRFEPGDGSPEKATLLRAAGIVSKYLSLWELAKRFAEDSLNVPGITGPERAMTLILLAQVYSALGQTESAKIHLQQIGEAELRDSPKIRRTYHHNYGLVLLDSALPGDRQEAEPWLMRALEEFETSPESASDHACLLAALSRACLETRKTDQARRHLVSARERAETAGNEQTWQRVLIAQGRVCAATFRMEEAYDFLNEASQRARKTNSSANFFEAQLGLYSVCLSLGRKIEAKRLREALRRQLHRVRLDAATLQESRCQLVKDYDGREEA